MTSRLISKLIGEATITGRESVRSAYFNACYFKLPRDVRRDAASKYWRWKRTGSLSFEYKFRNVYAVELINGNRALCTVSSDQVVWRFIGDHRAYDVKLDALRALRNEHRHEQQS